MGNPRSAFPAEISVFFLKLSGGDVGSRGASVQRGMLVTVLIAVHSFLARAEQARSQHGQNLLNTGLSFAKAFQTKIQRAAVRRNAQSNSSPALQMPSNIYNPSAQTPICKTDLVAQQSVL